MASKGIAARPVHEERWGSITHVTLPSGSKLGDLPAEARVAPGGSRAREPQEEGRSQEESRSQEEGGRQALEEGGEEVVTQEQWSKVNRYITDHLLSQDDALDAALRASAEAGLPNIAVSPAQGKMLMLLARMQRARTILEIGTLGGYSTIWLARALPAGGRVVTLEYDPKHAEVARKNIAGAGLSGVVEIVVGAALETLPKVQASGPFDMFFIDADKPSNPDYFAWALRLSRPGSLIIVDNVVRDGAIVDAARSDPPIEGTRRLYEAISKEPRVTATAIQTVGSKGYDGFAMAIVEGG